MLQSFIKPLYHDIKTLILDTLFPITCALCEKEGKFICADCQMLLTPLEFQICIVCKKPSLAGLTHPKCQNAHTPNGLVSFFDYHDPNVSELIIKGKYFFLHGIFKELGEIIAQKLKTDFPGLLAAGYSPAPVPLNFWRLRWRGFNQSQILAEALAKNLDTSCANVPFDKLMVVSVVEPLVRCNMTRTQKDLKKSDRVKNVENAFALSPPFSKAGVRGSSFLLVDDVTTTGSTLLEVAKVLKRNGAEKVWCLTVARD